MNQENPEVQPGFRKGRGTRDLITNICWIIEKAKEFQKNIYCDSLTTLKPLTMWITTNCDSLKRKKRLFNDGTGTMRYLCGNKVKIDPYCRSHNETVTGRSQT